MCSQEMLSYDPEGRITAQDALKHAFFTTNEDEDVPCKHRRLTIENFNELSSIMKKVDHGYNKHKINNGLNNEDGVFFDDSIGGGVFDDYEKKKVKKRLLGDITNSSGFYRKKMK